MLPKGKLGIPAVRDRLLALALGLAASRTTPQEAARQLLRLLPHLVRNKPPHTRTSRIIHRRITRPLALEIWRLHRTGAYTEHEIADRLDVGPGRVSEVLHGLRYPDAGP